MASDQSPKICSRSEFLRKHVLCSKADCGERLSQEIRLLPCLDPCCRKCLNIIANQRCQGEERVGGIPEENFCCPREGCGKLIPNGYLEQNAHANLNRWLCELVKNLEVEGNLARGEQQLCTSCELRPAVAVCFHNKCYDARLCERCLQYHRDNVITKSHDGDIVAIERVLQQMRDESSVVNRCRGLRVKQIRCPDHDDQLLNIYCKRTHKVICLLCSHGGHRRTCSERECRPVVDFMDDADHRPRIEELREAIREKRMNLRRALVDVENIKDELLACKENTEERIRERKDELFEELQKQERDLLDQVDTIYKTKKGKLEVHSKKLKEILQDIESSSQFVDDFLDNYVPTPVEFFFLKDHIQTALEDIKSKYESHDFQTRENSTLNYDANSRFSLEGAMGHVSSTPDATHFRLDGPGIQLRATTVKFVRVTCRDSGDTLIKDHVNMPILVAKIVPNEDGQGGAENADRHPDAVNCTIIPDRLNGMYSVGVFPPSRGPIYLWIYEDCPEPTGKRHIHGSPFDLVVGEPNIEFPPWQWRFV